MIQDNIKYIAKQLAGKKLTENELIENINWVFNDEDMGKRKIKMDVEPTVQIIYDMVDNLIRASDNLKRLALKMRKNKDLTYAAEAINTITNCMQNLRLDLLVTRPLREYQQRATK